MNINFDIDDIKKNIASANIEEVLKEFEYFFEYINSMDNLNLVRKFQCLESEYLSLSHRYNSLKKYGNKGTVKFEEILMQETQIVDCLYPFAKKLNEKLKEYIKKEVNNTRLILPIKKKTIQVPLVRLYASAGNGGDGTQGILSDEIEECISFDGGETDREYVAIRVKGDSMTPSFQEGDTLICKKVLHNEIEWGKVYVIVNHNDEINLKRVLPHMKNKKYILKSDNPNYLPKTVSEDETTFWLVVDKV